MGVLKPVLFATLAGALISATPALAADMAVPVKAPPAALVPSWTGFYLGAGAGFRSSETDVNVTSARDTSLPPGFGSDLFVGSDCRQGRPCFTSGRFDDTAPRLSLYAGYNWQIGSRVVLGAEADWGFADKTTSRGGGEYPTTPFLSFAASNNFSVHTTWDASARARAGYLIDPGFMVYATGGAAWQHVETTSNCSTSTLSDGRCSASFLLLAPSSLTNTTDALGWTAGGGIEAMLWANWIARAEYRFADFGTIGSTDVRRGPFGVQTVTYDTSLKTHTATFGLAYKFGDQKTAADGRQPYFTAPTSWNGVYAGAGVGLRADSTKAALESATVFRPNLPTFDILTGCIDCSLDRTFNGTSFRLNPYLGINWQFAPTWVAGIEGDFGWARNRDTAFGTYETVPAFGSTGGTNDSYSIKTAWDASVRARLGYLINPGFLLYATGGAAWMNVETTSTCSTSRQFLFTAPGFIGIEIGNCTPGLRTPVAISQSTTQPGFTIGFGGEAHLWSNWFARAEYRYSDFGTARFADTRSCNGSATVTDPNVGTATVFCTRTEVATNAIRLRTNAAMFGLSYKFDWTQPVVANY